MKMSEEFPSKYLKAADLQGREVRVTMAHVEREKIGDDAKPVLYFKAKPKKNMNGASDKLLKAKKPRKKIGKPI